MKNKKGQAVIFGLFRTFVLVIMGIFLMNVYPAFRDMTFASTESLWIRLPVMFVPLFYFIGVAFSFVNAVRSGSTG